MEKSSIERRKQRRQKQPKTEGRKGFGVKGERRKTLVTIKMADDRFLTISDAVLGGDMVGTGGVLNMSIEYQLRGMKKKEKVRESRG